MSTNDKSDGDSIVIFAIFCVGGCVAMFIVVIGAAIALGIGFLCFVMTILSCVAWSRTLRIGRITIHPQGARAFVLRGLFFAAAFPTYWALCSLVLSLPVRLDVSGYLALAGYIFGSIGIELLEDESQTVPSQPEHRNLPQRIIPSQQHTRLPSPESFRYASWDDEEERQP